MFKGRFIFLCLALGACATVTPPKLAAIDVQSITVVEDQAFDLDTVLSEAKALYEAEKFFESRDLFQQVLLREAGNTAALIGYGNTSLALGQHSEAHAVFEELAKRELEKDLTNEIQIGLILSAVMTEKSTNPETQLNNALQLNYQDARVWNALGQLLDRDGAWMRALDNYVRAMRLGGAKASTINNMGMSLLLQGRYNESLDKFEQATELDSNVKLFDNNRRLALILLQDYEIAFQHTDETSVADLYNDAGYIEMQRDNPSLATQLFKKAIEVSPRFQVQAEENLSLLVHSKNQRQKSPEAE